ncbi:MAG: hypothetical protein WCV70_02075 [Patescibacteria group bacterium]|jgi:hypothetical protein
MFDELDKNAASGSGVRPAGQTPPKTEDIFSEVDKIVKPEALRPRDINLPPAIGTVIPAEDGWLKNKKIIFGLILGVLIIVFGGGYLGLRLMAKKTAPANLEVNKEVNNDQLTPEVTAPATGEINNAANQLNQPIVAQPVDSDSDGLTDEEEVGLGINSNNPDSDSDGLTDREEVKVYKTDPLKADTDGDGFKDGAEVKNNYNPNGQGRLYEIDKSIK